MMTMKRENVKIYELEPTGSDSHKSFYKKATVCEYADAATTYLVLDLYSYGTLVSRIRETDDGFHVSLGPLWDYSATTLRHIKSFICSILRVYPGKDELRKALNTGVLDTGTGTVTVSSSL